MRPRILYVVEKESLFNRLFLYAKERKDVDQAICLPNKKCANKTHIKQVYCRINEHNFMCAVRDFKPNVFVVCDEFKQIRWMRELGIKTVYVSHGEWPRIKKNIDNPHLDYWKDFSLLCNGMIQFKDFFKGIKHYNRRIVCNALLQYDCLWNAVQNQQRYRCNVLKLSKKRNPKKIISLFGPKTIDSPIHSPHNEGFYASAVKLAHLAKKNNWLIIIKPKRDNIFDFIESKSKNKKPEFDWARKLKDSFFALTKDNNVLFVSSEDNPHQYFCSDLLISNSRTGLEIEAALARKPLIKIHANSDKSVSDYNIYGTLDFGAAYDVSNVEDDLEKTLKKALESDNLEMIENQRRFVEHLGLKFDGKAQDRILDAIKQIA